MFACKLEKSTAAKAHIDIFASCLSFGQLGASSSDTAQVLPLPPECPAAHSLAILLSALKSLSKPTSD